MRLSGRVVLVTGASLGLGEGIARALGDEGVTIVGWGHDDVDDALLADGMAQIGHRYGQLDAVVNAAAVAFPAPVAQARAADLRRMVDANVLAPMLVNHAALPLLRAGGNGHIFNLTTVEGRLPMPGVAGYAATMAAVVAYTDSLRKDVGREGIRVTLVMTGGDVPGDDVGNAIADAMAQPPHVVLNELLLRPMGPAR